MRVWDKGKSKKAENLFSLPICVIMVWVMKMDNEKELPKRKDIRLKNYDYSSPGAYFVTICTENRKNFFWNGSIDPQTFKWCSVGAIHESPANNRKNGRFMNRPYKRISAEIFFSLPICGIMGLTKSLALRERWRRSRQRGQIVATTTLSPATAGALPEGEP